MPKKKQPAAIDHPLARIGDKQSDGIYDYECRRLIDQFGNRVIGFAVDTGDEALDELLQPCALPSDDPIEDARRLAHTLKPWLIQKAQEVDGQKVELEFYFDMPMPDNEPYVLSVVSDAIETYALYDLQELFFRLFLWDGTHNTNCAFDIGVCVTRLRVLLESRNMKREFGQVMARKEGARTRKNRVEKRNAKWAERYRELRVNRTGLSKENVFRIISEDHNRENMEGSVKAGTVKQALRRMDVQEDI